MSSDQGHHNPRRLVHVSAILTLTSAVLLTPEVRAETLNGPSQYATIQAANDAALPGDEAVVADGVYCLFSSSTPANCSISWNTAFGNGGGLLVERRDGVGDREIVRPLSKVRVRACGYR